MLAATKKDDNDGNTIKLYNRTLYSSMEDISNIGIKIDCSGYISYIYILFIYCLSNLSISNRNDCLLLPL